MKRPAAAGVQRRRCADLTDLPSELIVRIAAKLGPTRAVLDFTSTCAHVRSSLGLEGWSDLIELRFPGCDRSQPETPPLIGSSELELSRCRKLFLIREYAQKHSPKLSNKDFKPLSNDQDPCRAYGCFGDVMPGKYGLECSITWKQGDDGPLYSSFKLLLRVPESSGDVQTLVKSFLAWDLDTLKVITSDVPDRQIDFKPWAINVGHRNRVIVFIKEDGMAGTGSGFENFTVCLRRRHV